MSTHPVHPTIIHETFGGAALHPALRWLNPPPAWRLDPVTSRLVVHTAAETDFWQRTHYGFRADNGHFLYAEVPGDAVITAKIHSFPAHQYDQAGLMMRVSSECWLKTSVEYEPQGASHLGAVVTNHGYSDWSLQDFLHDGAPTYCLRIRREREDCLVECAGDQAGPWRLLRVARLLVEPGTPAWAGFYACSPTGSGYRAEAEYLTIELS
jgi:regulation of enolase protein 1 (concanavalin A-like superfamily)